MTKRKKPPEASPPPPEYPAKVGGGAKTYWPSGKPIPTTYRRRPPPIPCPSCRCLWLEHGGQATALAGISGEVAWLWCKACKYRWKAPSQA